MHENQGSHPSSDGNEERSIVSSGKKSKNGLKSRQLQIAIVAGVFGLIGIFLLVRSFAAEPDGVSNANVDTATKKVERYGMRLVAINRALERNPANNVLADEATQVAQDRKAALIELMKTSPRDAAKYVLPASVNEKLGAEARKNIESVRELNGKLEVYSGEDFDEKTNTFINPFTDYYLVESNGKKTRVHFGESQEKLANKTVKFTAAILDDNAVPTSSTAPVVVAAETTVPTTQKSVAVLVVNFAADPQQPVTTDQIKTTYFGDTNLSAKRYIASSTYNKTAVTGDVFGYYTIADDPTTACNYSAWATSAKAEATKAGVDLSKYTNIAVYWPTQSVCSWAGLGQVNAGQTWINGYNTMRVTAHELGHNFGSSHASAMQCSENGTFVTLPTDLTKCTMTEYGDPYTIMGGSSYYELSNVSRQSLQALSTSNVKDVTATGTFQMQPIEVNNDAGINMIRIPRATTGKYDTVEFRQTGFGNIFDTFPSSSAVANGLVLRLAAGANTYENTKLLDFNPSSNTYSDAPLLVGGTFKDPETGVTVSLEGISNPNTASALATVKVDYGQKIPICTHYAPTVSAVPLSQWGEPGQALAYSLTVTNNDVGSCTETSFDVASGLPSGFTWTPATTSVKLQPGASTSVTFTVTSGVSTGSGYYSIPVTVTNNGDTTKSANASVNYNIASTADTTAPSVTILQPANGATIVKKTAVRAQATDNVAVTTMEVYVDNKLLVSSAGGSLSYSLNGAKYTKGAHVLIVKAYDASGNVGSSSVTINK